jgi:hypothetical protein
MENNVEYVIWYRNVPNIIKYARKTHKDTDNLSMSRKRKATF